MKSKLLTMTAACALISAAVSTPSAMAQEQPSPIKPDRINPFVAPYNTPYEIPPFEEIQYSDYMPAIKAGIKEQRQQIEAIVNNPATPTFENTILALDHSGELLEKAFIVFAALDESMSSPEMVAIAEEAYPLISQLSDEISMNEGLFARVKYLYDNKDALGFNTAQKRVIDDKYKSSVRSGALLNATDKEQLKRLNTELTDLYLKFNKNLLNATNEFQIVVDDKAQLSGLPASSIAVAAEEATARNLNEKWVFTLHAPSRLPVLQYADCRDLRRLMFEGYTNLASSGEYDNRPVIDQIIKARAAKAKLLGFDTFAAYMIDNVMAKTVDAAENLLLQIWEPAIARVDQEVAEMQAIVDKEGGNFKIAPWDYYYYAEKVRQQKYDLNEDEVRQYFQCDSVLKGVFYMANKLYGVTFTEMPDAPKYHPEVKVYDVTDAQGKHVAVFMTDYFPRASKRQGAWMSEFKGAYVKEDGTEVRPVIYNVGNFTKPTADTPSLLTIDEVETMFHEFGHGLHGMLTRAHYKSQAGTNVDRDFVELPSQIHEHWAFEPEMLKIYAHHYKTGEPMPDELITKLAAAATHNQGFATTELVGAALLDIEWGKVTDGKDVDVDAFEMQVKAKLNMPEEVEFRYRSPYFKHIFGSDAYASGYYTYLWAEVLDADGFELFKEKGIFDKATADAFLKYVLEAGDSDDPMTLYVKFRGQEPSVDALLSNRGLK